MKIFQNMAYLEKNDGNLQKTTFRRDFIGLNVIFVQCSLHENVMANFQNMAYLKKKGNPTASWQIFINMLYFISFYYNQNGNTQDKPRINIRGEK